MSLIQSSTSAFRDISGNSLEQKALEGLLSLKDWSPTIKSNAEDVSIAASRPRRRTGIKRHNSNESQNSSEDSLSTEVSDEDNEPKTKRPKRNGSKKKASRSGSPKVTTEQRRHERSRLFNALKIGLKVQIVASSTNPKTDITVRQPHLKGKVATIKSLPVYPCTWVTVKLSNGELIKLRSTNFQLIDVKPSKPPQPKRPQQTERLRRSLFFNSLHVGTPVLVKSHYQYRASQLPLKAQVVKVPVFPSTWLTVREEKHGKTLKLRTTQIEIAE